MPLLNDADVLYLGIRPVDAVYLDGAKVWPSKFDPNVIAGLDLWLDASALTATPGQAITAWPDLSGNHRTLNIYGSPAFTISPILRNGLKVVRFATNAARLRAVGIAADKDYTLAYVARMWGSTAGRVISGSYPPSNILFGWWGGFEDKGYAGGWLLPDNSITMTTNWKLYSADASALPEYKPTLYSNGLYATGNDTNNHTDGWINALNLSGYDATEVHESCDCEVAELLLYSRKLPDADRQTVEDYLRGKWGM